MRFPAPGSSHPTALPPRKASGTLRGAVPQPRTYAHGRVDLCHRLLIRGELVYLDPVADELTHDLTLEFVQLVLGDGVGFCNDRNNVHLRNKHTRFATTPMEEKYDK